MNIQEATPIVLTEQERSLLEAMMRSAKTEHGIVERARIVLLAAEGRSTRLRPKLQCPRRPLRLDKHRDSSKAAQGPFLGLVIPGTSVSQVIRVKSESKAKISRFAEVKTSPLQKETLQPILARANLRALALVGCDIPTKSSQQARPKSEARIIAQAPQ